MEIVEIKNILKKYNQEHLLKYYDELNENEKNDLIEQIVKIDFELMEKLFNSTKKVESADKSQLEAIDNVLVKDNILHENMQKLIHIGSQNIIDKKFAVITMAGGQGTRLGHNGPKGTYMLDIHGKYKSIFEILIDKLKLAKEKYGFPIPWYIMTSKDNNNETIDFFEQNNYFEYGKENVSFFIQGELPMLDMEGKIILESKAGIKFAADGNGGVFNAISTNILQDIINKNIQWVYICGVDNILVNFVDEGFLGGIIENNLEIGTKSVLKDNPYEKVGIICKKNNKPCVVEYTEISDELANSRKTNGELLFSEANIVSNIFSVNLLSKVTNNRLPYHTQIKKCMVYREGKIRQEDAYKFEAFIFDIYKEVDNLLVYRVKREEEFAPIKNKEGVDSPKTAKELYEKQF